MIKHTLTILFLAVTAIAYSQENTILFDGKTNDWEQQLDGKANDWEQQHFTEYNDSEEDGESIELKSLKITNDETNLYLTFTLEDELLLNSNNDLTLYLDTDQNQETGYKVENMGAELRWVFGERRGDFTNASDKIYHNDIGFSALPTVTSDVFEVKISLDAKPDGITDLFQGNTFNILIKSEDGGDAIPNSGEKLTYVIDDGLYNDYEPIDFARKKQTDLRVMAYNVLDDGINKPDRQPHFERIFKAVEPDVIVFNETWDTRVVDIRNFMNNTLPLGEGKQWQGVKEDGGNIIASRYRITDSWHLKEDMRLTGALIDLPDDEVARDILVVGAHFRCCDANEARQREADAFIEFVLDAKTEGGRLDLEEGTPIMLAGDLNLVGFSQQLETLLTGEIINTNTFGEGGSPDWDGSDLKDVVSFHTDNPYAYTWTDDESSYWPGRLDFTIWTNSVGRVLNKFTVETGGMSSQRLDQYGLQQNDTREASDHLPKVTDIQIYEDVSVAEQEGSSVKVISNPAHKNIKILPGENRLDSIRVVSGASGRVVMNRNLDHAAHGAFTIKAKGWEPGVYILILSKANSNEYLYEKVIVM